MSLVNTPWQRNLIPSLSKSSSTFSPSWLMALRLFISTTSSRPSRSVLDFSHAVRSSVAQGAMSLPSKSSRRCLRPSQMDILNTLPSGRLFFLCRKWNDLPALLGRNPFSTLFSEFLRYVVLDHDCHCSHHFQPRVLPRNASSSNYMCNQGKVHAKPEKAVPLWISARDSERWCRKSN
jgi:hypothetical protein